MATTTLPRNLSNAAKQPSETDREQAEQRGIDKQYLKLTGLILGLSAVLLLMLLGYAAPMVFGGMSAAAVFAMMFKNSKAKQLIGAVGVAIIGGLAASATLYYGFNALENQFWPITILLCWLVAGLTLALLSESPQNQPPEPQPP
ncbi:hypothetical protein CCANI_11650 [Corynebacterium canis]|uniref:hypothetical protein n=1 Tax=Corynebacterium canis TaxID=679663 RepID=UPI001644450A|nr:hypothetical protein [Corynebacterium canis]WJY76139.1 hypothetical protein CCANI_11650 [Corynebacterium canis]